MATVTPDASSTARRRPWCGSLAQACILIVAMGPPINAQEMEWDVHSMSRPKPPVVAPSTLVGERPVPPPSDAVALFDGSDLSAWQREDGSPASWAVRDGYFEVAPGTGSIQTRGGFGDVQLHLEFATPNPPAGEGQDRGNSGVFLMGYYEVQILDSYRNDTYADGQAGAIYGQYPPLVNASRPPGEWQTYDIIFRRPRFDAAGKLLHAARMTVLHNGVLVHDAAPVMGRTAHQRRATYQAHEDRRPLSLQDHGHRVRFRNIWIRELAEEQTRSTP